MTITAKVICDSISEEGVRLTSIQARYPRFIHAELMTHRVFSRNASSSRAIPIKKVIQDVIDDPAMPIHWGKHQPGMQAKEENDVLLNLPDNVYSREEAWLKARDNAIIIARAFETSKYHKQIVNRLLEPFSHINVLITSTQWSNFFALRRHPDAQPEMVVLANAIWDTMQLSNPFLCKVGNWHLPYITHKDGLAADDYLTKNGKNVIKVSDETFIDPLTELLIRVSVARSARTSYNLHDGSETTFDKDLELYDRLVGAVPLHASPTEHQATPDWVSMRVDNVNSDWSFPNLHGNFSGWIQYRKLLSGECQ